jgi:CheY-like chemotaxis protein
MPMPEGPAPGAAPPDPATAARVLVIDDEPQIRKFVDIALRSQGYATRLAATGEQGLSLLASQGADIVVLDLGLPDRDGLQVLQELRQWSRVPVIVLTVRSAEEQKVALLDAGANDYVTKPFGIESTTTGTCASIWHAARCGWMARPWRSRARSTPCSRGWWPSRGA